MKVYSPTSTIAFDRCPLLWLLKKERLRPNIINRRTCAAAVGIGFAAGINQYFQNISTVDAAEYGSEAATKFLDDLLKMGATIATDTESTFEMVNQRVYHAILAFGDARNISLKSWEGIQSELVFPDQGHCRIDFVGEDPENGVTLIDFKTRVSKPSEWSLSQQLREAEQSWQLKHYIWACKKNGIPIESYGIMVVVFEPRLKTHQSIYVVDPEEMQRWYQDALTIWKNMQEWETFYENDKAGALNTIRRSTIHYDRWGKCDYHEACFGGLTFSDRYVTLPSREDGIR